ncbi:protein of unknown function [Vibrio tapetis subsp. tapetis]|uniref:Uncharacterized protein n=1 Tax=Vibrio tapetis subsp. tapetis TaxID=1671868 RepID=A0A2N8Z9X9_9VIBR|nr:protein of unknown function [Vibrio tapetis subsp. tapetis]
MNYHQRQEDTFKKFGKKLAKIMRLAYTFQHEVNFKLFDYSYCFGATDW